MLDVTYSTLVVSKIDTASWFAGDDIVDCPERLVRGAEEDVVSLGSVISPGRRPMFQTIYITRGHAVPCVLEP